MVFFEFRRELTLRNRQSLGTAAYRPLVAKILDKIGAYSDAESGSVEERCFHLG
jgi:hypothetical protein